MEHHGFAGCLLPVADHVEFNAYYAHESNTGKSPNQQQNAIGLVLYLYRGWKEMKAESMAVFTRCKLILARSLYLGASLCAVLMADCAGQNRTFASSGEVNVVSTSHPSPHAVKAQQTSPGQQRASSANLSLPLNFAKHTGDLDGMVQRHEIRALVVYSRSGFFYDAGQPKGIYYEALDEFQRFVNQKFRTGALKINVTYIPVRPEQLEQALLQGVGDVIAFGLIVTPEREKEVLFTTPIDSHVKQVLVTGPKAPPIASLEDLRGKEAYVNPLTAYYQSLQHLSQAFQKAGAPPILMKSADPDLTDEDLLEMVNASLIPATVTINIRAEFWAKVLPHLMLHPNIVLKEEGQLAWATRQDSPQLRQLLNEFVKGRETGTVFGNIMLNRYLRNAHWVEDATSTEELKKFQTYVHYFQRYAAEYDFDYLMLVAQGYETLMTLAAYNAGPTRIAGLRKRAASEGLDPNRWFGNVELMVAKDVGEQTVQYVSNIYKYYVAYKLTLEESRTIK
jgi:membrane-bound lytic murein transglycosylase MltF